MSVVSDVCGTLVAVLCFVHVGRKRLIRRWHGPPPAVPVRPWHFWSTALTLSGLGVLATLYGPGSEGYHVLGTRLIATVLLALLVAGRVPLLTLLAVPGDPPDVGYGRRAGGRR